MWSSLTATTTWWPIIHDRALGESKPNTEIFRLLAKAMGFNDPCFAIRMRRSLSRGRGRLDLKPCDRGWKRIGPPRTSRASLRAGSAPVGQVEFLSSRARSLAWIPADYVAPTEDTRSAAASAIRSR